jgi:hypothetical protein
MSNQKTEKIRIKTSEGIYDIVYVMHTESKTSMNTWISNFWWEIPEDEQINKDAEPPKPKHCWHEWKEYIGFTERYWYCEKCDNKSQENPNKCF